MTATPKPHILVVDDDPLTRMMATEALREGGFATAEAEDGVRALAAFEALHPDLVLLNVMMPGLVGRRNTAQVMKRAKELLGEVGTQADGPLKERARRLLDAMGR